MPKFIYIGSEETPPDAYGELILNSTFTEALLWNANAYAEAINSPTFVEGNLSSSNAYAEAISSPTFVEGSELT